ncbi:hypothetical protein [Polaribacter gangjinensis]|uniref:Serine kinase n=1 Tax=Polaribacter gangjinensis TaxID=574710 RepID=A0A2S7WBJ0_9FLAO|nr:hypothetical protein [Polaribacter gangjinensis]PQJ74995.1 hypothetical protein BTO13_06920 [Polaribacter gangjinensis]
MTTPKKILLLPIEDKTIVWFAASNEYVVFENEVASILQQRISGSSIDEIALEISSKMDIPFTEIKDFIENLEEQFLNKTLVEHIPLEKEASKIQKPKKFEISETYLINDVVCKVSFLSKKERELVHPKFAHLVTTDAPLHHHLFEVFINNNEIILYVNNSFIGTWHPEEVHYFQGKFSMELIQKIHQKEESKWMGVFHASAVSDGKQSILFLGDSGNGKSTSLALLQANGFTCLADDFVPIAAENKEVYSFPAAISIKKNSLQVLDSLYPSLADAIEYDYIRLNKIVRYLPPNNADFTTHLPCKKLIFIKYEKEVDLQVNSISKLDAFQQLIPDSWLSPLPENAAIFLDWFAQLECFQIKYSENEKMIAAVRELFEVSRV